MDQQAIQLGIEAAIAIGIGLFVGLEREHRHVDEGEEGLATALGVRTFSLLALLGWLVAAFGAPWPWLGPITLAMVGLLIGAQYVRQSTDRRHLGLTTEVAALLIFVLGMVVHHARLFAVGMALITTLLLISKPWVRSVVPALRRAELTSALQLAIVLAIVLPLLPAEPLDPWGVLPPRRIGLFVVLVAGIGFVGYVLSRLLGRSRAAGLTGAVGGLVSSTALTAAMASQARGAPSLVGPSQVATLVASAVACARVLVIVVVIDRALALQLLPPLAAMGLVMAAIALWASRRAGSRAASGRGSGIADFGGAPGATGGTGAPGATSHASRDEASAALAVTNPFALLPALKWGLFLCVVLLAAHGASQVFGSNGLLLTAAGAGLADVDAVSLAAARQSASGLIDVRTAALAIAIAVMVNTIVKALIARVSGGRSFGGMVAVALGASVLVGGLVAVAF